MFFPKRTFLKTPKSIRFNPYLPYQIADPFLFILKDQLYCFFEKKNHYANGSIWVQKFDLEGSVSCESIKVDLQTTAHLSYPYVFEKNGEIYMMPETAQLNEVALYKSKDFPLKWVKTKSILSGKFVDSYFHFIDDVVYLFTTRKIQVGGKNDYRLELYYSDKIDGPFSAHPNSPIITSKSAGRSGGCLLSWDNKLFRVAQNCSKVYGGELDLYEVIHLNTETYSEKLYSTNWVNKIFGHIHGGHHIHKIISEDGNDYIALDLNYPESYYQRFIKKFIF